MMLKELNVIKYFILFSILILLTNCSVLKDDYYKTETYEIIREKSKYWTTLTQLNVIIHEYENKNELIPASVSINGIILQSKKLDSIFTNFIHITPNQYNLEIYFIGKETINIKNLLVKKGDSIVIKAYMKVDLTPLY